MSTNYPGALDSFVNPTATDTLDSATVPHAAQHDNANDSIRAIQVTLGVNPQGGSATVVARLTALDSTVAGKAATDQTMFIGTTSTAINRSSASQTLTGVNIDGNAQTATTAVNLSGTQTAKFVYAAPNATNGTASFRALLASDIPTLNQDTTGNAGTVTNGIYTNAGNTFTTGTQVIATGADGTVGFRIKRNSPTQSANLLEITQSDGTTILAKVDASGNITTTGSVTATAISGLTTALSVAQGGTGATTLTAGNALIGNGTSAITSTAVTTGGGNSSIVKTGTTGGITAGAGGFSTSGSVATGSGSGTAGSLKLWASAIGASVTLTAPTLGSGVTADQVFPTVAGTLVSTGMTSTNAQVTSGMIVDGTIVNGDINASAAIVDTKLDTIATTGKVSNSATTATSSNTASAIVARDSSGNFTAGTVSASVNAGSSGTVATQTLNVNQGSTPIAVFKGASSSFSTTVQAAGSLAAANTATLPSSTGTILTDADTIAITQLVRTGSGTNVVTDTGPTIISPILSTAVYRSANNPTAVTTSVTVANILAGYVYTTISSNTTCTLPTFTNMNVSFTGGSATGVEWSVVNTGSAILTLGAATGHVVTNSGCGSMAVAAGTSAKFFTRKTSDGLGYVTMRFA
jgi:hypothetical protein